jgi:hypothetical protein
MEDMNKVPTFNKVASTLIEKYSQLFDVSNFLHSILKGGTRCKRNSKNIL